MEAVRCGKRKPPQPMKGWIGGASVSSEIVATAIEQLGLRSLQAVYGMTEVSGTVSMSPLGAPREVAGSNRSRSVSESLEVGIFNNDGEKLGCGATGEIWVRGYPVMLGYYGDNEATRRALSPDGWFKTGDLGILDADGYLRIVGRKKEMFIVGGANAYPAEIERILQSHPEVRQAVVVGVADGRLGEVGFAFIQWKTTDTGSVPELTRFARANMADYKVPRFFEVVASFPMTSTGKIVRAELAARAAKSSLATS
jgi:acyl-CoA synthetase (AMP-forming)/AMP-acid ligase II